MNYPHFSKLIDVIKQLRDPESGCPWDLKQDHKSLLKYLVEECYEYIHSVESSPEDMEEELGDVLLQVVLHTQIASESGRFDIETVSDKLTQKMIRRHPHVFKETNDNIDRNSLTDQALQKTWDKIKTDEKTNKNHEQIQKILDPLSFLGPSLQASSKIGAKTKKYNFDWDSVTQVMYKVEEEWQELKAEIPLGNNARIEHNQQAIKEELGDLLFSVAQLARHLDIEPEECLREANYKFLNRFNQMNQLIQSEDMQIEQLQSNELEDFWQKVKSSENK